MEKEIWRLSPSCNCKYEVSNLGQVRPISGAYKNKILKQSWRFPENTNYNTVEIYLNGKKRMRKVHRLVAEVFCSNINNYPLVMHLDNNIRNNQADNLMWGTYKMNFQQALKDGLVIHQKGEGIPWAKLTDEKVKYIRETYVPYKYTLHRLAKELNVSFSLIAHVLKGRNWNHI